MRDLASPPATHLEALRAIALRLSRCFNTTPKFWLNLQASYDLAKAAETSLAEMERMVQPREAA